MNMWIKNANFLKRHFLDFYNKATAAEYASGNLQISDLNEGKLFLRSPSCQCYLHSRYDIDREMREMLREADDPEQILIIFGLGMGYCLDYIQKQRIRYRRVLILEPFNNIFREMLKWRDIELLLKKKGVSASLFNDVRQVIPQIIGQVMSSRKVKFVYHLSYRSLYSDVFEEISRVFSAEKLAFMASTATLNFFMNEWSENQLISIAKKQPAASILNDKFRNIPAVIISAGPSLEKRIDELKEIGEKAVIIAPGTGARICKQTGIKAHVAIAIDSQKAEADIFRDSHIDILVGSYRLHPQVDKTFPKSLLRVALTNDYIAQYYLRYLELPVDTISDHASVSSTAVDLAVKLGCNPIILVGQDLCYYDNKEHAGEEKDSLAQPFRNMLREAVDINGEKVQTRLGFLAVRRDMELLNLKYQDTHTIINASEAGLGIPGIPNHKFGDVIKYYIAGQDVNVREIMGGILDETAASDICGDNDIDIFYQHLLDEIKSLQEMNDEKLDMLEALRLLIEEQGKEKRVQGLIVSVRALNSRMYNNYFYRNVVMQRLNNFLVYYQAGVFYNFAEKNAEAEAFLYYESQVYNLSNSYLNRLKAMTERVLSGSGESKQYEGVNFTVANKIKEGTATADSIRLAKEEETENCLTIPFS